MTIVSTQLVDDGFKVINKVTGARNENEKLVELDIVFFCCPLTNAFLNKLFYCC